jgi:hypothetical protein
LFYVVLDTDKDGWLYFGILIEFISQRDGSIQFFLGQAAIRGQEASTVYSILLAYHFGALSECCGVPNKSSEPKTGRDEERSMA